MTIRTTGRTAGPARGAAVGLVRACHPLPTLAVTILTALIAAAAAAPPGAGLLVVAAVLTGQLVIGWSNDRIDVARDRAAGRADKPLAGGALSTRTVDAAIALAAVLTLVLSLATGWRPGLLHVVAVVGGGLAYNAGLKSTVASWLPYAAAFGALPAVVWLAAAGERPEWWLPAVGALLGIGAHLLNVLPDLDDDARTGVRGLPHVLGARGSRVLAGSVLLAAVVVVALGPDGRVGAADVALLAVGAALAVVAAAAHGRWPFRAALLLAGLVTVSFLLSA